MWELVAGACQRRICAWIVLLFQGRTGKIEADHRVANRPIPLVVNRQTGEQGLIGCKDFFARVPNPVTSFPTAHSPHPAPGCPVKLDPVAGFAAALGPVGG